MAFSPISFVAINYDGFKNYWLKAYEQGETTPLPMALESDGGTQVAKLEVNKDGFLESAGGALVIPYIDSAYDLFLFPTEAEADANNTTNAEQVADNITGAVTLEILNDTIATDLIADLSQSYEFDTMQDLIDSTITFPDGKKASITGYLATGVGGGKFYWDADGVKTEHDGGLTIDPDVTFYTISSQASIYVWYNGDTSPVGTGVWRRLVDKTVIDDWYGVITNSSYVFNEAFVNRKAYEVMLNNTDKNDFTFAPKDELIWIVGSVNVGRSDITVRHLMGCRIKGRYDDPPNHPGLMQAGHMFGFVSYVDPLPEGPNNTLTGDPVNDANYILDGEVGTEFNAIHSQPHNNNVIAFFHGDNCSVTGTGGVTECDHNALAFDGLGINSKINIDYISNYDDRAVTMKGTEGEVNSASINIGRLSGATRNGTVGESILVQDLDYVSVTLGDAVLNLGSLGTLVNVIDCNLVDINCGYLENAIFMVALNETGQVNLNGGRYKNVTFLARRGGVAPQTRPLKKIKIRDMECVDSLNSTIFISQLSPNEGLWNELDVRDCDFSAATGTFTPYSGKVTLSKPARFTFKDNFAPSGWVTDIDIYNVLTDRPNTAVGGSSFTYDIAGTNGDNPYQFITVIMTHSSSAHRYPVRLNLRDLRLTGADYRESATADDGSILEITTVITGTSVLFSFTATAGTGSISSYSLGN